METFGQTLIAMAVIAGAGWLAVRHLSSFNRSGCRGCGGSGKQKSSVFGDRYRVCVRCGGKGWRRGLGGRSE